MKTKAIFFICILSLSFSYYLPMKRKSIDFGADVCRFDDTIHDTHYNYVKGCEKGKYCASLESTYNIHKCQPYTPIIKMLGENCKNDFECDSSLKCISEKCSMENDYPYNKNDIDFCPSGQILQIIDDEGRNSGKCISATNIDKCYIRTKEGTNEKINTYAPDYFKICGKISYEKDDTAKLYIKTSTDMNYYGEVNDGEFVEDEKACKSGYALYFYGNKELTKPFTDSEATAHSNDMFKLCVTVKEVEFIPGDDESSTPPPPDSCIIKYTKGTETEYIYDPSHAGQNIACDEFLLTKLELFQKLVERMNSIRDQCVSQRHYDAPFLCDDNELKKLQYFYDNPKDYLLYQNENQVVDYLVQSKYKTYEAQDLSKGFLNLNYFILLLLSLIFI